MRCYSEFTYHDKLLGSMLADMLVSGWVDCVYSDCTLLWCQCADILRIYKMLLQSGDQKAYGRSGLSRSKVNLGINIVVKLQLRRGAGLQQALHSRGLERPSGQ